MYFANYLLLGFRQPVGRQLTTVVVLPPEYTSNQAALKALANYCRLRFQARGCECQAVPDDGESFLGIGRQSWLHPSLRQKISHS